MRRILILLILIGSGLLAGVGACPPVGPLLFHTLHYQSPVRGEPNDLLMLPGRHFTAGDTVVYQSVSNSLSFPYPPSAVPTSTTASAGVLPVVSAQNIPDSLTVQLPSIMTADQTYAIWVKSPATTWSQGIMINDARPLWITPDEGYTTATTPGLATRYLKVVGRNLQHAPAQTTQVRLTGPATYTMNAADDANAATAIEHYVAMVTLPGTMTAGTYTVAVNRDGVSWVPLFGQSFTVTANPATPPTFNVSSYGCIANDGLGDELCIYNAMEAARLAGGGTVVFGAGTFHMLSSAGNGPPWVGLGVPVGVNLQGAGAGSTIIMRGASWNPDLSTSSMANFVLQGHNIISGFTFSDARTYAPSDPGQSAILFAGTQPNYLPGTGYPSVASHLTITGNVFNKPFIGIAGGGIPIDHLIVTNNTFGAYKFGMVLNGTLTDAIKHTITDAIFTGNTFRPGSYLDNANVQGAIASHISSTRRSDVSGNTVDGTSTTYLQVPASDAKGFRGGLFWRNLASIEMNLTSQNTLSCTGDKNGDGEAIAYDSTDNPTFPRAQFVTGATPTTVSSPGPLPTTFSSYTLPAGYFNTDYWVQVVDGPGVGQMRRITNTSSVGGVTFTIAPPWDVLPTTASRITLGNVYWQVATVDNLVDSRTPLCQKSNQTAVRAGVITLWGAPGVDLAVEGNHQYDTDGIALNQYYSGEDSVETSYPSRPKSQYFVDIRRNLVDGEYDWTSKFSTSGIWVNLGASPTPESPPPVMGYGVSIARNTVIHADASNYGGGISLMLGSFDGPPPFDWKMSNNTLIYLNTLEDLNGPPPAATTQTSRYGITLTTPLIHNTVLASNIFTDVTTPLFDAGLGTLCLTDGCVGAPPAYPTANLTLHVDASDTDALFTTFVSGGVHTGTPTNGSAVQVWDDEGGGVASVIWSAANSGVSPLWRSPGPMAHPCLDFDGTDDLMASFTQTGSNQPLDNFITVGAYTLFIVFYPEVISATATDAGGHALITDLNGVWGLFLRNAAGVRKVTLVNWDGAAYDTVEANIAENAAFVVMARHEAGNLYLSVNGGSEVGPVASGNTTDTNLRMLLGGLTGGTFYNGCIGEMLIYNAALSGASVAQGINYLLDKW